MTKIRTKTTKLLVPFTPLGLRLLVLFSVLGLTKGPIRGINKAVVPFLERDIFSPFSPLVLHAV